MLIVSRWITVECLSQKRLVLLVLLYLLLVLIQGLETFVAVENRGLRLCQEEAVFVQAGLRGPSLLQPALVGTPHQLGFAFIVQAITVFQIDLKRIFLAKF